MMKRNKEKSNKKLTAKGAGRLKIMYQEKLSIGAARKLDSKQEALSAALAYYQSDECIAKLFNLVMGGSVANVLFFDCRSRAQA